MKTFFIVNLLIFYTHQLINSEHPTVIMLPAFLGTFLSTLNTIQPNTFSRRLSPIFSMVTYIGIVWHFWHGGQVVSAVLYLPILIAYMLKGLTELPGRFQFRGYRQLLSEVIGYFLAAFTEIAYLYAFFCLAVELLCELIKRNIGQDMV